MGNLHHLSFQVEKLLRKLNKDNISFYRADEIDEYPLMAFSLFFGTLYNHHSCSDDCARKIVKIIDEVTCCIHHENIDGTFSYHMINDNHYIKGTNNKEIIQSVIKEMKQCFHEVYGEQIIW